MFWALDFYPWRVFSPEDSPRLRVFCIYKPPSGIRTPRQLPELLPSTVGLARQVTSNSSLCTSGPAAVIQVSFIPSCLEVTYLLHLPFPITTESLRWLQARSRSSQFLWQTGQAGILLIRGSAAEDTRLCLPSGSDVGNGYFFVFPALGKAACFPVNSRRSLTSFEGFF